MAFVVIVIIVTVISLTEEEPAEWIFYLPLFPLFLLAVTGIYLFVLPYAPARRSSREAG